MLNGFHRVTSILFPFSGLSKIPTYILKNAAERGTKIHEICTAIMDDMGVPDINPKHEGYIESFSKWCIDKTFLEKPPRFFCNKHMITGEVDGVYKEKNGDLVLIDIKTPAKESRTWPLQGSAYYYLCKANGYEITRIEFIQLLKNGELAKTYCYKEDFDAFLECYKIYKLYFNNIEEVDLGLDYI